MEDEYIDEFMKIDTIEEFLVLCKKHYPKVKYIDLEEEYEKLKEEKTFKYENNEILPLTYQKELELKEMKRFGYKITRAFLLKYGFTNREINYLVNRGDVIEEQKNIF